jgi:hypothetical protein
MLPISKEKKNGLASIWNGIRRSQGSGCWAREASLLSHNLKCHLLAMAQANLYIILLRLCSVL